ncbi:acyl carrier protein [Methylomagnum sp.]
MNKPTIINHLKTYLQQNAKGQTGELTETTQLLDEWFADSMEVINMVLFLEKQFGIKMRDSDISAENFETLDTLSNFVLSKLPA